MTTFEEIEIVRDITFIDIVKDKRLIQLYNWAADRNIIFRFYIDKANKEWLSHLGLRAILIPFNPEKREIVPGDVWLEKIYLAHELGHFEIGVGDRCCLSCLYQEMKAWIRGWEILRSLDIALVLEEKKYKEEASKILKGQCKVCLEILGEKPEQCLYATQIKNLLKAYHFELIA